MQLFYVIRDFFVKYIFGGTISASGSDFNSFKIGIGAVNGNLFTTDVNKVFVHCGLFNQNGDEVLLRLGDWLSTTFTWITLFLFLVAVYHFLKWLVRFFSNSFLLR